MEKLGRRTSMLAAFGHFHRRHQTLGGRHGPGSSSSTPFLRHIVRPTPHSMLSEFTRACVLYPQVFFIDMLVVYCCCPETRGRSLEEIDLIFMSERLQDTATAKQLEHDLVPEASVGDTESWNEGSVVLEKEV